MLFSSQRGVVRFAESRKFSNPFDNIDIIIQIEKHSRNLCYKLYKRDYLSFVILKMASREVPLNLGEHISI